MVLVVLGVVLMVLVVVRVVLVVVLFMNEGLVHEQFVNIVQVSPRPGIIIRILLCWNFKRLKLGSTPLRSGPY